MSTEPIRVAVIGTGKIAEVGHLPGLMKAGARIAALCNKQIDSLNLLGDRYKVEARYLDWKAMLADGGFDAVSICTPPALHREMAVACLERGYHTLVEKPMAVSLSQCDDMIAAAEANQRLLMVAHNQRFRAQHVIAKQILDTERLGSVRRVHAVFAHGGPERWSPSQDWYFESNLSGYGVLLDLGYHKIDLLCWLLGQKITHIQAVTAIFEKPTSLDDTALALIQFDGGTLGTLQVSWAHHPDVVDSVQIDAEYGTLAIPSDPTEPVRIVEQNAQGELIESAIQCHTTGGPGWFGAVGAFVNAVRLGLPSPVPGSEGKAALAAVLKAYASVNTDGSLKQKD